MFKLRLQYFGHLLWRVDSLDKTLMLGKIEGRRRRDDRRWDGWMPSSTRWTWVWVDSGSWWWTGRPGVLRFNGSQRIRQDWAIELNWTKKKDTFLGYFKEITYKIYLDQCNDYHMWFYHSSDERVYFLVNMRIRKQSVTSEIIEIIFLDSGIDFGMGILPSSVISDSVNYPKGVLRKMHWRSKEMRPWRRLSSRPQKEEGENVANDTQLKIKGRRQK